MLRPRKVFIRTMFTYFWETGTASLTATGRARGLCIHDAGTLPHIPGTSTPDGLLGCRTPWFSSRS